MQLEKFNLPKTVIDLLSGLEPALMGTVYAALTGFIYNDDESIARSLTGDALDYYNEAKSLVDKQVRRARAYRRRKEEIAAGLRPAPRRKASKPQEQPNEDLRATHISIPFMKGNLCYGSDGLPIPMDTPLEFCPDAPYYKNTRGIITVYPAWPDRCTKVIIDRYGNISK